MTHANAPLTPTGRQRLVDAVVHHGWTYRRAAERFQVSVATVARWVRRHRDGHPMTDRSSRPHHHPNRTPRRTERRIVKLRHTRRWGPARIAWHLGLNPSTVHRVLRRYHMPKLAHLDQITGLPIRRESPRSYIRQRPGELVHMDIKKLGRIPDGGGHRFLGRATGRKNSTRGIGYSFLHHVVDDATRLAYSEILDDEKKETITGFWKRAGEFFAGYGIHVESVMTDNGPGYRSKQFNKLLAAQQVKHLYTRPYRPQTNGKVERCNKTLATEWAYAGFYPGEAARAAAYPGWVHDYNHHRPHSSLGGRTPAQAVHNLTGQYT